LISFHGGELVSFWSAMYEKRQSFFQDLLELEKQLLRFLPGRRHLYSVGQEFVEKITSGQRSFELNTKSRLAQIKTILELLSRINSGPSQGIKSFLFGFSVLLDEKFSSEPEDYRVSIFLKVLDQPTLNYQQVKKSCKFGSHLDSKIQELLSWNHESFNRFNRASDKKRKSLKSYVEGLYKESSRQYVVRCLLTPPLAQQDSIYNAICKLVSATKLFFKTAPKQHFFSQLNGYIWKLESPVDNKPSVQVILFFNADEVYTERNSLKAELKSFWEAISNNFYDKPTSFLMARTESKFTSKPKPKSGIRSKSVKNRSGIAAAEEHFGSAILGLRNYKSKEYKNTLCKLIYYFALSEDYFDIQDIPVEGMSKGEKDRKIRTYGRGEVHVKHKIRVHKKEVKPIKYDPNVTLGPDHPSHSLSLADFKPRILGGK